MWSKIRILAKSKELQQKKLYIDVDCSQYINKYNKLN
jgi:hypothetical protein